MRKQESTLIYDKPTFCQVRAQIAKKKQQTNEKNQRTLFSRKGEILPV